MLTFDWLNRLQNQFHLGNGRAVRRYKSRHGQASGLGAARSVARLSSERRQWPAEVLEDRALLATIVVNSLDDAAVDLTDSVITLRDAIAAANGDLEVSPGGVVGSGADEITFDPILTNGSPGVLFMTTGTKFDITSDLTITGPGADRLTIDADTDSATDGNQAVSLIFNIDDGDSGSTKLVSISGLTLTHGNGGGFLVGGIINKEQLAIDQTTISESRGYTAGGILNTGMLTISNSTISVNSSANAGGISSSGTLTISNSTISDNRGVYGGGIISNGTLSISNSTISGNSGSLLGGTSFGGGISCNGPSTITNCTISGNAASYGGGISNDGTLTVTNTTISGNGAGYAGGGITNYGTLTVTNSTISGNRVGDGVGGGISNSGATAMSASTITLANTIVAGNTRVGGVPNDIVNTSNFATIPSAVNNLIGNAGSSGGIIHGVNGNIVGNNGTGTLAIASILKTTLADNGGPTKTLALVAGGPAIDAGNNAAAAGLTTDQRGTGFDRILNGVVDIGAFESSAPVATIEEVSPDPRDTAVGVLDITFNESVTGVDITDFTLTRTVLGSGVSVALNAGMLSGSGSAYQLDLSSVTNGEGTYLLRLKSNGTGIIDAEGNETGGDTESWVFAIISVARSGNNLTIADNGIPTNDNLTLSLRDANTLIVQIEGISQDVALAGLTDVVINGLTGNDTLILDFANGALPFRITYNGGNGGLDSLVIQNAGVDGAMTATYANAHDGVIAFRQSGTPQTINFTGLEPISIGGLMPAFVFNLPSTSDTDVSLVRLSSSRLLLAGSTFEQTDFDVTGTASITINANAGSDRITLGNLTGYSGAVIVNGGTGNDVINASSSNVSTILRGDAGNDTITGSGQSDTLTGGAGKDSLDGRAGTDTVVETTADEAMTLTNTQLSGNGTDQLARIERAVLTGSAASNTLDASAFTLGNVTLLGGDGNDTLIGGSGNDSLDGGAGSDVARQSSAAILQKFMASTNVVTGAGNDLWESIEGLHFIGSGNAATMLDASQFTGNVTLSGGSGNDRLIGGSQNNVLNGNVGNDVLVGGNGANTLNGGAGNDLLLGNDGSDLLYGQAGNDTLRGGNGDDRMIGDEGRDILFGGSGSDLLNGGEGSDVLTGESGDDSINGEAGNDAISGGEGNDILNGGLGSDTILGGSGDDVLRSGGGADYLSGGAGSDRFVASGARIIFGGGDDTVSGSGNKIDAIFIFDFDKLLV